MTTVSRETLEAALRTALDPDTGIDFVTGKAVRALECEAGRARLTLEPGYPVRGERANALRDVAKAVLLAVPGVTEATVEVTSRIVAHAAQRGAKRLPGVKNVIAVASGKGGVGKSTTAVNLALALAREGARTGILDADIYGPSLPTMLGLAGRVPVSPDGKGIAPLTAHGVEAMSIGFLTDAMDTPMIWRGPMAARALDQLICDTRWSDLDYLVVDMPPGTGDAQLTLAQKAPVTGAVIVTTPQDIALIDARKGLKMFEKVGIAILGVVENMSIHICAHCGHTEHIFGAGGARKLCAAHGAPFLGSLPLDARIREQADGGNPTVVSAPDSPAASLYRDIARRVAAEIARRPRDLSARFPPVVVARTP
ncbi:MAG: iron-sulfur cluster carrier protein ApbC [Zoogloeaceae bacterium]|jgi:ATP-binding protein involved in chromosome partitioning|nr:iron-sulfur cluster carrier protein ApbC [Zoogloeaceae bacterium]